MYVDEYQEYQGQPEEGGIISPKNGSTIDLTVTSASDIISVDNTNDELVIKIALIETPKPFSRPAVTTSSSSS